MNLFCPVCLGEYLEGVTLCKKCNKTLVRFEDLPAILPYCPVCQTKYPVGSSYCEKCLSELIFEENKNDVIKPTSNPDLEIVTVYETSDMAELILIKSALEQNKIDFNARGEGVQNLFAGGLLGGYNPITGGIKIDVEKSLAEKAMDIIKEIADSK
jgi:hypothetical protein